MKVPAVVDVSPVLEGEIIGPGEPDGFRQAESLPVTPNPEVRISVDVKAWLTEGDPDANYFKNWNQKWRGMRTGVKEGPFS